MPNTKLAHQPRSGTRSALHAFCVLMALSVVAVATMGCSFKSSAVGQKLPDVSLDVLTGEGTRITSADLAGHVVLLNFWGTWCPPCVEEFPHIVALDREFRGDTSFKLVSVSMYAPREPRIVASLRTNTESFLQARGADIATYVDSDQTTWRGVVGVLGGKSGVPTTLILDRDGVIRGVWSGYGPGIEREMRKLLVELLQKPA